MSFSNFMRKLDGKPPVTKAKRSRLGSNQVTQGEPFGSSTDGVLYWTEHGDMDSEVGFEEEYYDDDFLDEYDEPEPSYQDSQQQGPVPMYSISNWITNSGVHPVFTTFYTDASYIPTSDTSNTSQDGDEF